MKKVVNSVLASALALTVAPAIVGAEEATTQAPQMDAGLEKVVKRLEALGLVQGYGNGNYGVDKTITRAEFATLVVRARGLEEGAKLAQYQSNFTDVHSADWFAGFVNVATGQEIVKGFPDKSFKPQNQVTYAEAVTMIVRALGYEPAVKGVWPNSMIAKASELNISKGIKEPGKAATRGDIFQMLDNAVRVDLMKQVEYGTDIRFEIQKDKTLLTEYLDVTVRDMDWAGGADNNSDDLPFVVNVPVVGLGKIKGNEITIDGKAAGIGSSATTLKVADGINPNDFAGEHVQVWVKDDRDDTIVWMEHSEDETVLNERIDTLYFNNKVVNSADADKIDDITDVEWKLDSGKTYRFAKNAKVTYNFDPAGVSEKDNLDAIQQIAKDLDDNGYLFAAKVVLNDNSEISYIHVVDDVKADLNTSLKYGSEVVEKVSATKITNLETGSFDLKDKEEGKDFLVFLNGKPAKLADLQKDDVYTVYYASGDKDKPLVFATRNVVEGKVDDVIVKSDNRLKIGDKEYRFRTASYSEDGGKTVKKIDKDTIRDLEGIEVKAHLDAAGRIRYIEPKDDVKSRKFYALVTKNAYYDNKDNQYGFTVLTEKGKKQNITIDEEDIKGTDGKQLEDVESALAVEAGNPVVVEVSLDSKGAYSKVQLVDTTDMHELAGNEWDDAADEDDNSITDEIDGKKQSFDVTSDTVVFDASGDVEEHGERTELKNPKTATFKNVADNDDLTVKYVVDEETDEVAFVFVTEGNAASSDMKYGLVTKFSRAKDSVFILTKDGDAVKEIEVPMDDDQEAAEEIFDQHDFIGYSLDGEGKLIVDDTVNIVDGDGTQDVGYPEDVKLIEEGDAGYDDANLTQVTAVRVDSYDDDKIVFNAKDKDDKTVKLPYFTTANTVYMNIDDMEETSLDEGDYAVLVKDDSGSKIDYVIVVATGDDVEENDYDMDDFLALNTEVDYQGDNPDQPGDDVNLVDDVEGKKLTVGPVTAYRITGQLASDVAASDIESIELKLGSESFDGEVKADGSIDFTVTSENASYTKGTLIVTNTDGDKEEVKDFTINN